MTTEQPPTALAFIRLRATRDGNHLTQAPGIVALRFRYDSQQCAAARTALTQASADPNAGVIPITLGDEVLIIDPRLHTELGAELLVLQVERDLGPLMEMYRPDPSPLH